MHHFDNMDIFHFSQLVSGGDEALVHYFQEHGMLRKSVWCFPCNRTYTLVKYKGSVTGYNLRCPGCRKRTSLQLDSFLDGAHVPLAKLRLVGGDWA